MPTSLPVPLRRADTADAPTVAHLLYDFNREYNEPTPEPDQLARRLSELLRDGDTAIALAGDPACGVAVMRFRLSIWAPRKECYLAELYVTPERRGQGIGRALLTFAMELARTEQADYMDLGTSEDDVAARQLYESLGFSYREGKPDGPINYYYEREL